MPEHSKEARSKAHYWLALKQVPRLAINKKIQLASTHGIKALFESDTVLSSLKLSDKQRSSLNTPDWCKVDAILAASSACQSQIIHFDDMRYPSLLKEIHDPPLVIFAKGNIDLLLTPQLAIVGSRSATSVGREIAHSFAAELVGFGLTVTSGLAIGIDANAHKGAIDGKGPTIAVVATGLDQVYPSRHKQLASEILHNNGLIVSEFPPRTPPKAGHFPKRNRIISGLSLGVLVVEAEVRSGSLISARCAMEQNREVFAVPSSIRNPQSKGCHLLIKQGAKLTESCADIIEELNFHETNALHLKSHSECHALEKATIQTTEKQDLCIDPLLASVGYEMTPIDVVVSRSNLPTDVVLTKLTMLELSGQVTSVPGGYLRL